MSPVSERGRPGGATSDISTAAKNEFTVHRRGDTTAHLRVLPLKRRLPSELIPAELHDLVDDLPPSQLAAFADELASFTRGPITRETVIALRIAGDPDIFSDEIPTALVFKVVRQLVDHGQLDEDDIDRYRPFGGPA